jgi:hypothetical protein
VRFLSDQASVLSNTDCSVIGRDAFYMRVCDPNVAGSAQYCARWDNDYLGWEPAILTSIVGEDVIEKEFVSCLGDSRPLGM